MPRHEMADDGELKIWFRDDIRDALLGVLTASCSQAYMDASPEGAAFRRGFMSALASVAVTFGIRLAAFNPEQAYSVTRRLLERTCSDTGLSEEP